MTDPTTCQHDRLIWFDRGRKQWACTTCSLILTLTKEVSSK